MQCLVNEQVVRTTMLHIQSLLLFILALVSFDGFAYSPYSTSELDELEKEFIQQINQSREIERTPVARQYINHLGKELATAAHLPTPYFFIVKSSEINAFAGPGGYIGVNTQLILSTESESELAAVMAHELAHVRLHHLYRMIEHQKQMRIPMLASLLASAALGVINPVLANAGVMASMTGFAQDSINFTRANEKEADRIGIDMLIRAGFDARGMAAFFRKMQQSTRYYYTANIPAILRTHPLDDDRIAEAENRIARLPVKSLPESVDYRLFKELIRNSLNENSHQLLEYYQRECPRRTPSYACRYGQALVAMNLNEYQRAETLLQALLENDKANFFYQIALAQAQTGLRKYTDALGRLNDLQANYPENYAALMAYSQALLASGDNQKAAAILLKGSRRFKQDLPLCEELARAQAASNLKALAYFTEAQCQLLQGRKRDAVRQLRLVKSMSKNDPYLFARANAKIDEIKFMYED